MLELREFNGLFVSAPDFNLEATLDSGQVFGFTKRSQNEYEGIIGDAPVRLSLRDLSVYAEFLNGVSLTEGELRDYFDLDRDLSVLYQILESDERLRPALKFRGLRLIRQDSWEALACFILSSNNNVKRIQGIWKNLTGYFGAFPMPSQIARSHERILRQLGLGYRAPYLFCTAQFVAANPACLRYIRESSYEEARARVLSFPGIGGKVADCVLLYGFQKYEAFPVDVWIARAMRKLYFRNRKISEKRIRAFAQKRWGEQAGYVQQYLFHASRMGVL